ncbi:MAG: hypothetical protein QM765_51815 [Myxococcales bacterium]
MSPRSSAAIFSSTLGSPSLSKVGTVSGMARMTHARWFFCRKRALRKRPTPSSA